MKLRVILFTLAMLAFVSASSGGYLYYHSAKKAALKDCERQAQSQTRRVKNRISSYLSENLKTVRALAGLREIKQVLVTPDENFIGNANALLNHFNKALDASVCYLMNSEGETIASSNHNTPGSFVGKNYAFRPYFKKALSGTHSVYMALGVTSNRRGVYYSHPVYIQSNINPVGVVVVKASVDLMESEFQESQNMDESVLLIADSNGVVFMSTNKDWLFHSLWKISNENISNILKSKQFGNGPLEWIGLERKDENSAILKTGEKYLIYQSKIGSYPGWSVYQLTNLNQITKSINGPLIKTTGGIVFLSCFFIGISVFFLYNQASSDIRQGKKAEKALRASEANYRAIFNAANDAVFIHDMETGQILDVNQKMCEMFGYHYEQACQLTVEDLSSSEAPYKQTDTLRWIELAAKGEAQLFEWRAKNKAGELFWVEVNLKKSMIGGVNRLLAVVRDISQRKKIEEAKKEAEQENKRLEAQLQRSHKMEALGLLAGGVAHDLNNVLSGIVSYPELLLMDLPEDSPLRAPISTIQDSGQKAATIVQDLLTLARRGVTTTEVLNLNNIVADYLRSPEHLKLKNFNPNVDIETHLSSEIPYIQGSNVHLNKTVMNLISNAAEAQPNGGRIVITTENRYIDKPIKGYDQVLEGDYVVLSVKDWGTGIAPDDLKRIFEPFYTKKVMGRSGTGLGMAVVWGTVQDHKGYIDVKSIEKKGTTFDLYFPLTRDEVAQKHSIKSIEDFKGHKESILVVDDVKTQREIAANMLSKLNYVVSSVSDGEEAVQYIKNKSPDLVVLDMIMDPGIDGLDTYKRMIEIHPGQKAIIVSGFAETDRVKKTQRLGAGEYIKKPYTIEKIGSAIKQELNRQNLTA
jgi:PAS domain S-box-containing protein